MKKKIITTDEMFDICYSACKDIVLGAGVTDPQKIITETAKLFDQNYRLDIKNESDDPRGGYVPDL